MHFITENYRRYLFRSVLALACMLLLAVRLQAQQVTLHEKSATLPDVFKKITQQTGYKFVYRDEWIVQAKKVTIDVKNSSLQQALDICFKDQPVSYSIVEKMVVLTLRKDGEKTTPKSETSPLAVFKGRVLDKASGKPLQGATIVVIPSRKATASDANGFFEFIDQAKTDKIDVSFTGYNSEEVVVRQNMDVTVLLSEKIAELDEVVQIAYGTTSKRLNTGNVAKISASDIEKQPVANPLATLDGRIPGLVVTQSTGVPGGSFKVQLRGRTALETTVTDDQPLFVIDGVPFASNNNVINSLISALGTPGTNPGITSPGGLSPFSSINPQDIESIEVLKDADATAIYGSRGANGVILITTKKGAAGKTKLSASVSSGVSSVAKQFKWLDTKSYLAMRRQAFQNDHVTPNTTNAYDMLVWDTTRYTDFSDFFVGGIAHPLDAQLSLSGGTNTTQFMIGGGYHRETSVSPGDLSDNRATVHFSINHTSTNQKLKLNLVGSYASEISNLSAADAGGYNAQPPNLQLYDSLGNIAWNEGGYVSNFGNPLANLKQTYKATTGNLNTSLMISYRLLKKLTLKVNLGYNNIQVEEMRLIPASSGNPAYAPNRQSNFASNIFKSWIIEPQVNYTARLAKGRVDFLIGSTWQSTQSDNTQNNASGYNSDDLMQSLSGATSVTGTRTVVPYKYEAIFGRANYNYDDKYLINFSGRRDGSSRFGPGKQFANFASIGGAWIFSKLQCLARNKLLSYGKLRASWGVTGNDKITDYQYLDTWASTQNPYAGTGGLYPNKLFNPDYRWEKTNKAEAAIELGFLQDRLLITTAFFDNNSSNQLVQYKLATTTGFNSVLANMPATVKNTGWEISIDGRIIKTSSFTWRAYANLTIPRNKLVAFPNLLNSSYNGVFVIGQSLNVIDKVKYIGVDPQSGLYTFEDVDKNGSLTSKDYQALGNTDPKFFGGIGNAFTYKGLQLDVFFNFRKQLSKNYLANLYQSVPGAIGNLPVIMDDFWSGPGSQASLQQLSQGGNSAAKTAWSNFQTQSNGIFSDASFIRLKNVSLSYSLPTKQIKKIGLENARVFLQAQNLLTISGYEGADPETQNIFRTPPLRTIVAGFQITL